MTEEEIDAAKSARGGWTKATLAGWGIPWPPPKGWRQALINGEQSLKSLRSHGEEFTDSCGVRRVGFNLRLETVLHDKIKSEAERRGVSVNKVINELITAGLGASSLTDRLKLLETNIINAFDEHMAVLAFPDAR